MTMCDFIFFARSIALILTIRSEFERRLERNQSFLSSPLGKLYWMSIHPYRPERDDSFYYKLENKYYLVKNQGLECNFHHKSQALYKVL